MNDAIAEIEVKGKRVIVWVDTGVALESGRTCLLGFERDEEDSQYAKLVAHLLRTALDVEET